uniref:ATP-grasp fold succinyl-CoA synthetase-type domain-containing protein n=1 Tax=Megaselia scalaris TaxID=36166 RepID=T1GL66_MEGSC
MLPIVRISRTAFQKAHRIQVQTSRNLNLLEYQSKDLLQKCGVSIQEFRVLDHKGAQEALKDFECPEYVVKAQILAGEEAKDTLTMVSKEVFTSLQ